MKCKYFVEVYINKLDCVVLNMLSKENTSFDELAASIALELYKFIFTIVRNKYLADDVIQETLMKGFKSFDTLKDMNKFKSWMFTIAKRELTLCYLV